MTTGSSHCMKLAMPVLTVRSRALPANGAPGDAMRPLKPALHISELLFHEPDQTRRSYVFVSFSGPGYRVGMASASSFSGT